MQRLKIIVAAAVLGLAQTSVAFAAGTASPSPAASAAPIPTPTPDPAVVARARSWFLMLQAGKLDQSQMSAAAIAGITSDKVAQAAAYLKPMGDPVTFEQQAIGTQAGLKYYVFLVTFGNGSKLNYVFAVDAQGKIAGLQVSPAQSSP